MKNDATSTGRSLQGRSRLNGSLWSSLFFDIPGAWCTRLHDHHSFGAGARRQPCLNHKRLGAGAGRSKGDGSASSSYLHVKTLVCFETRVRGSTLTKFLALADGAKSRQIDFDRLHAIIRQSLVLANDRRCATRRPPTSFFSPSVPVLSRSSRPIP